MRVRPTAVWIETSTSIMTAINIADYTIAMPYSPTSARPTI